MGTISIKSVEHVLRVRVIFVTVAPTEKELATKRERICNTADSLSVNSMYEHICSVSNKK